MTTTRTYAILGVSSAAYSEIKAKLIASEYSAKFHVDDDSLVIDMDGLALKDEGEHKPRTILDARQMCRPGDEPLA